MENALVTKARSIYGKLLKDEDFNQLIKKRTVGEVAAYLRAHPFYFEAFSGVSDQNINRKRLEEIIRKYHFTQTLKLIKFAANKNKPFYEINVIEKEHQIIMSMLKSYISDDKYDVINDLPIFFDRYSKLDLYEISKTKNIKELVVALKGTVYEKIMNPYVNVTNDQIHFNQFEMLLEQRYNEYVSIQIKKFFKGKVEKDLLNILNTRTELNNVVKVYRLKKFYHTSDDEIKSILVNKYNPIKESKLNALLNVETPEDLLKNVLKNRYENLASVDKNYIENYMDSISYQLAKKTLLYSQKAPLVYMSYLTISDVEIDNLIHIIEGIRYGVPESEIREIIII
ncbi:V-type ATPase subunit [Haploplasma axanthum]|nr:V-type ATPase subunit [Haploplasma axanthum]